MLRPEPCSALIAPSYLLDDQLDEAAHELAVALDRRGAAHVLGQHEVQVAVLGVSEHGRVRHAVALEEGLAVADRLGQALDGNGDVFAQERRPARPHRSRARGEPLAQVPERRALGRAGREARRLEQAVPLEDRLDVGHRVGQRLGRPPAAARSGAPRAARSTSKGSGCSSRIERSDAASRISSASAPAAASGATARAGLLELVEEHERRRACGRLGDAAKRHLRHEAERPLRARPSGAPGSAPGARSRGTRSGCSRSCSWS